VTTHGSVTWSEWSCAATASGSDRQGLDVDQAGRRGVERNARRADRHHPSPERSASGQPQQRAVVHADLAQAQPDGGLKRDAEHTQVRSGRAFRKGHVTKLSVR